MRGRTCHSKPPELPGPRPNQFLEQYDAQAAWRERRLARAAAARAKGYRFGTICRRGRGYRAPVPDLRLSGHWLQRAGFDLGQQFEIEVHAGRLTIRAVL